MPRTGFSPSEHGFHFDNRFVNKIGNIPGFGEVETYGRCGGMAFAALDYYFAGMPIPSERGSDFPDGVPPDGHLLADSIYRRLLDSFLQPSSLNFVTWTLHADHRTWFFKGVTGWTREDEFSRLRGSIDQGRPVPLGLVSSRSLDAIGRNHQVVAYGYDVNDATGEICVYVYDNNHHDVEVTLTSRSGDLGVTASTGETWRGFFVEGYSFVQPAYQTQPLPQRDAQFVSQSVPASVVAGQSYPVSVTMRNTGSVAWTPEEAYRLGSQNPQDNSVWGITRVDVPGRVEPGGIATFQFASSAPRAPGGFAFQWRMLQEQVEWFGETTPNASVAVEVPHTCRPIEDEIHALQAEIRSLQEELHGASPGEKAGIVGQIRRLQAQSQAKRRQLEQCVQGQPTATNGPASIVIEPPPAIVGPGG